MRIVVVMHRNESQGFEQTYLLGLMATEWRKRGIDVDIARGIGANLPADLAILHVDLTFVPHEYSAFARRYPQSMNADVLDISKRAVSSSLVTADDGWSGPVIVKTDLNSRGAGEIAILGAVSATDPWRFVPRRLSLRLRYRFMPADSPYRRYALFDSTRDVPPAIWHDRAFVVERFLPERDGDDYLLRAAFFFGETCINYVFRSSEAIVRGSNVRDPHEEPAPAEVHEVRRRFHLDFGRIDYAIVDGRVVVYDVNKTPSHRPRSTRAVALAQRLAASLDQ